MLDTLYPYIANGTPIVGLEPSCLLTLRDEYLALIPGSRSAALAEHALLFEEFLAAEEEAGNLKLSPNPLPQKMAFLHGHCHQKLLPPWAPSKTLRLIPGLEVKTIASSCCGMAGNFGYQTETYDISMKMGELALLPAVRDADATTLIVADGTSCRHQIRMVLAVRPSMWHAYWKQP